MFAALFTNALPLEALYALSAGLAMAALAAKRAVGPSSGSMPMPAANDENAKSTKAEGRMKIKRAIKRERMISAR